MKIALTFTSLLPTSIMPTATIACLVSALIAGSAFASNDCVSKYLGKWKCNIGGFGGTLSLTQAGQKTLIITHVESGLEHQGRPVKFHNNP